MQNMAKQSFVIALALGFLASTTMPALAAKAKTEDELIAELADPNADKVYEALAQLEKQYPTSTKAFPTMKKLLTDPREKVRRKAGRVLGVLHADVDATDLKNICVMLKAADPQEAMDALKSLRGLKAESVLPEIVAQLKNPHSGVVRDACRTVAVLGNKSNIPDLEPLTKHADAKVQKDAKDAIFALNAKS
jgi:HEAT repeat protein